jgi:hypothetical protein
MSFSLNKTFKNAAIGGAALALTACAGLNNIQERVPTPDSIGYIPKDSIKFRVNQDNCVSAAELHNAKTPEQLRLVELFKEARKSPTGYSIMDSLAKDNVPVCYDDTFDLKDACGFFTLGVYYSGGSKLVKLNSNPARELTVIRTLVHEGRHKEQDDVGALLIPPGNYMEHEYLIKKWTTEADARLSAILYGYERAQKGDLTHINKLRRSSGYSFLLSAFENSLANDPNDMHEAMRSVIKAFRRNRSLARNYDNNMIDQLERLKYSFNPGKPVETILTDDLLNSVGEIGSYGNYMNQDLMSFIRSSVSYQDYKDLKDLRQAAGGRKGAACKMEHPELTH